MTSKYYLTFLLFFFSVTPAVAQNIEWNQPEVVREKLMRDKRRVLHFSGRANPGTQIRVRDNKVKMIFSKTNTRWARIPQKHRYQFPVIASDTGYFSFKLYLPTTDVEIPLEVFRNGKWMPYKFSFEVPEDGAADNFKFIEDSFKYKKDEDSIVIEDFLSEYDKSSDQGQVVNDRDEWKSWATGKIFVWGALGGMYYNLAETLESTAGGNDDLGTFGGFEFPAWEVGAEYRWNEQWKIDGAFFNRSGGASPDGNYRMQNEDFNWTELRMNLSFYSKNLEFTRSRFGFKGGFQMHDIPFVKRSGTQEYRVFTNSMTFLAAGMVYESMNYKNWNYDISAMFIYPVVVDNEFDADTAYGVHMNFSILKEVIPALYLGGKVDMHWITMAVTHPEVSLPSATVSADVNLWQFTPSFLIKAEF